MNKVHYDVTGLQNTQMKTQLKNSLDKLDGVRMINVDMSRSSVEVEYNQNTDEHSIMNCIEHAGCKIT